MLAAGASLTTRSQEWLREYKVEGTIEASEYLEYLLQRLRLRYEEQLKKQ